MKWFWVSTTIHAYASERHMLVAAVDQQSIRDYLDLDQYHTCRIKECELPLPTPRETKNPHIYNPWSKRP